MKISTSLEFNENTLQPVSIEAWRGEDGQRVIDFGILKTGSGACLLGVHYNEGKLFTIGILWFEVRIFNHEKPIPARA